MNVPIDGLSIPQRLVSLYADMDRTLRDLDYGPSTVATVTRLAVTATPGAEDASISEGRNGQFRTLAGAGELAAAGDRIQYELKSGPCVDAIVDDTAFRTGDIQADPRWPEFGARVHAETGTTSMMSLRLFLDGDDRVAALNFYSTQRDVFDNDAAIVATVLATHTAAILVATAARERAAHLERAVASNRRIGMAMGVLMASHKIAEQDAFALLRIASQNSNRKLADIADQVIETGQLERATPARSRL